jgi:hypothetical protein
MVEIKLDDGYDGIILKSFDSCLDVIPWVVHDLTLRTTDEDLDVINLYCLYVIRIDILWRRQLVF